MSLRPLVWTKVANRTELAKGDHLPCSRTICARRFDEHPAAWSLAQNRAAYFFASAAALPEHHAG